jgi:hypothetical protein
VCTAIYATLGTQMFRERSPEFFGDLATSLFTMFQVCTRPRLPLPLPLLLFLLLFLLFFLLLLLLLHHHHHSRPGAEGQGQ